MGRLEHRLLLDSSILSDLYLMETRPSSTVFVTMRSSTDGLPCLPLLDTLSRRLESVFQEPSPTIEAPLLTSPLDLMLLLPSPLLDSFRCLPSLESLRSS